jgi:hypothetical protein
MIALAVTGGVIVYVYSSGLMGPLQGSKVQQPYLEQISLSYYQWSLGSGNLTLKLRNSGSTQLTLADFFIAGNKIAPNRTTNPHPDILNPDCLTLAPPLAINVNAPACWVTLHSGLSFTQGVSYNVRVVTKDGAIFDFTCVAGTTN